MKYDVFISYSSKDSGVAFEVCAMLEEVGVICWIAPRNVSGGKSYAREIIEAITESQVVVFIFSSYSNCSSHVESEIDIAFNQEKIIIPFRIEEVNMSPELTYYINKKHHIDGIPEPALSFDILKDSVLNNIPRLQRDLDKERAYELLKEDLGDFDIEFLKSVLLNSRNSTVDLGDINYEDNVNENEFNILQNGAGELCLLIGFRNSRPGKTCLICDESSFTILFRNNSSAVFLEDINPAAVDALNKVDQMLVVELNNDQVAREYVVPVVLVEGLKSYIQDDATYDKDSDIQRTFAHVLSRKQQTLLRKLCCKQRENQKSI